MFQNKTISIEVMPRRIQRKRTEGWKSPEGCEYVGRPTKWGNPFKLDNGKIYIDAKYRKPALGRWVFLFKGSLEDVIDMYKGLVFKRVARSGALPFELELIGMDDYAYWVRHFNKLNIQQLKGKDLSCFCSTENSCHADVLIELANKN